MKVRSQNYQKGVRAFRAKNYATAYLLLIRFAEEGDDEAQTIIGSMYQLGLGGLQMYQLGLGGLQVDKNDASKWYLLASEKGNGLASNNLGTMALMRGDREQARRYYQMARNQGFLHAPMKCEERWRLMNESVERLRESRRASRELREIADDNPEYDQKSAQLKRVRSLVRCALNQLEEHVAEHGCGRKLSN
jgi:TPR repeat protein